MAADKSPSDEKTENPKVHNLPKDCYLIRFFQTKKHIKRNRKKNRETSVSRKGPRSGLRPFIKVRRRKGSSANKTPQPNKKRPSNNNTITPRTREYIIQFFYGLSSSRFGRGRNNESVRRNRFVLPRFKIFIALYVGIVRRIERDVIKHNWF